MANTAPIIKAHCNSCSRNTNQTVVASHSTTESDSDMWCETAFETLQCLGCDHISFRRVINFSENMDYDDDGNPTIVPDITQFPPARWRREPKWLNSLPSDDDRIAEMIGEVYSAMQAGTFFLACLGSRAILDRVIVRTVGDLGTFEAGLKALVSKHHISENDQKILKPVLEAGHASMHRAWKASADELETVMDIIENLIHRVLVLPAKANALDKLVPKRKSHLKVPTDSE